jgi:hypothetical protein
MLRCSKSPLLHTVKLNVSDWHAASERMTHRFSAGTTIAWIGIEVGTSSVAATQPGCALLNKGLAWRLKICSLPTSYTLPVTGRLSSCCAYADSSLAG